MKKLLLLTALGLCGVAAQAAEALTDASFAGFTYDSSDNLWKSAEVKLSGTYFADNSWVEIAAPSIDVTNQTISLTTPAGMGYGQWQGQVKILADVALSSGENYDFSCFIEGPADSKVTLKLTTSNEEGKEDAELAYWNQPSLTSAGKTCYFISGFSGLACDDVLLILDFGGYPNSQFTVSDMVIRKHVDDTDVPADPTYAEPSTVPTPSQAADDVLSLFTTKYTNVSGFAPASWGQATQLQTVPIDGQNIYFLKNFTFQGWTLDPAIDIADYDYLHIDYWTPNGTNFEVTPINTLSTTGTTELAWKAQSVNNEVWNSFDIPVSYWASIDLTAVNQFKVDVQPASDVYGYIANIYFYKSDNGNTGGDEPSTGEGNGASYTETLTGNFNSGGTDYPYTIKYTATWNKDATVTFDVTVDTQVPGIVAPQLWNQSNDFLDTFTLNGSSYTLTTAGTYAEGESVFALRFEYALNATLINLDYKVGASNTTPGEDDGDDDDDDLVGNEKSYSGTITGTFNNAMLPGQDVSSDIAYKIAYTATWNADATVTIEINVDPVVVGLVPQLNESGKFTNFTDGGNGKYTITTTEKYEEGQEPFALLLAYAGGAANETLSYTVGAEGNDGTTGVQAIGNAVNAPAVYYNLQGVRVLNPVKGQLYIVNGKKVIL